MELEQLRQFLKVAELGSFTRAAEAIGLSQPALSRSIARLEEELGQPLFERQTRKVVLCDAGQLLLERARTVLTIVDDVRTEICDDGQSGRLRIAAIPTIAPYFLPACLRTFQQEFPRAKLVVQEETTENLLKKLADGELDLAVAALPIPARYLQIQPLFEEELLLVTSANHPLTRKKAVRTADLHDYPFVLLGETHCLADNVITFCRQQTFHPVTVERTSQLAMVQELVALGHGISLIPEMARVCDTSPARHYRQLQGDRPFRTVVSVTNPYRYQTQLLQHFQRHLQMLGKERQPGRQPLGK